MYAKLRNTLKSSLRKFYGGYGDIVKQHENPISQILRDTLKHDHIDCHPPLIRHYILHALICDFVTLLLNWTLPMNFAFYQITRGFHRLFATDVACQQMMLTPPSNLSSPTLLLAYVQC